MSTARVAGLAALQSGDIQTAITQLETAVQEDPSDFDACLYLGGAYGQAGRPLDAIKAVTQAVQLQPANAQARYNLGVAMEQGGYAEQALQVYNQVIQLQPDYPNAREAITRVHANSNQGFGAPVSVSTSTIGSGQKFGEEQAQPTAQPTQQYAQPAAFGQQPQQPAAFNPLASPQQAAQPESYNPLAPPQQSAQPTQAFAPPTQQQTAAFGRPPTAVGQPQQPAETGLGSYMAPPPPAARASGGYEAPTAYGARPGAYSSVPAYDDEFKMGQAFKDFFRALFTPRTLFSEMAGCDTTRSAWALFVVYGLISLIFAVINSLLHMSKPGGVSLIVTVVVVPVSMLFLLTVWVIFAGIVQMLSRAFGSSLRYGASFRSVIYAAAPYIASTIVFGIVASFMMPQIQNAILASNGGLAAMSNAPTTGGTKRSSKNSSHAGKSSSLSKISSGSGGSKFGSGSASSNPFGAGGGKYGSGSTGNPFGAKGSQYGSPGSSTANPFGASESPFGARPMPSGGNVGNPFALLQAMAGYFIELGSVFMVGMLWGVGLLGVAVSNIHEISGGAAAGVSILSAVIAFGLSVGAYILFAAAIFAAVMSSMPH